MNVISHRGYWKTPVEKNSLVAFERSFRLGLGTELDVRDRGGVLAVSHDPADAGAPTFAEVLKLLVKSNPALPLAINIKADGLQQLTIAEIRRFGIMNYFLFDMSVPDALQSVRCGLRIYTRHSDLEPMPVLYSMSAGVWADALEDYSWLSPSVIQEHVGRGKKVCVASPELHRREHLGVWARLRDLPVATGGHVMLCTDLPEQALEFFR